MDFDSFVGLEEHMIEKKLRKGDKMKNKTLKTVTPEELHPLYVISGISGSGKTTLGVALKKKFPHMVHIDQDAFFLKDKPKVKLSDGSEVKNWDCLEAIDSMFTEAIRECLMLNPVLLTGFALCREMLPVIPVVHIHLVTSDNPEDLESRCKAARSKAKNINVDRDALVVKELVVPFYHYVVRNSDITHILKVFNIDGERVPLMWIVLVAKKIVKDSASTRSGYHFMDISEPYHSLIKNGKKVVEGRKITEKWKEIRRGDTIKMSCPNRESFIVRVNRVNYYLPNCGDPLIEYLTHETLERALPGIASIEEGCEIYLQWSTKEEIQTHGMMAICVEKI